MKYLVELFVFEGKSVPMVVCDSEDKAQEWIDEKLKNAHYSGIGKFKITKIIYHK